jgi:hypothetical protein
MVKRQRVLLIALVLLVSLASFTLGAISREARIRGDQSDDLAIDEPTSAQPTKQSLAAAPPITPGAYPGPSATPRAPTPSVIPSPTEPTPSPDGLTFPLVKSQIATPTLTPSPTVTPSPTLTLTPSPTPTPTLPWPPALERPGNSKLGLHVQWNNSPEIMEFIRRTQPPVVKAVGDFGFLAEVREASPSTVIVARIEYEPRLEGDPAEAARAYVARHLDIYRLHSAVDYWEGINEPQMGDRMEWLAAFEAERARVMAGHGFRVAVGAFSTGTPEWDEFERFLPAIEAAKRYGGALSLHEYDAPLMQRSAGAGLPGHPNHPDRGALMLRYRWWYEDFLKPRGLQVPLIISEAGVDGLVGNRPGPKPAGGWLDFAEYWMSRGWAENAIDAYMEQLDWYDEQVRQDDYVIGFAVFTAGAMGQRWQSYDVTHILRHIATYIMVPKAH